MRVSLPLTSAPCYFFITGERRDIAFNQFAYPALQVQSVINRATEHAVTQNTSSAQPLHVGSGIQGTYSWQNNPGSGGNSASSSATPGRSALSFATSQYFEHDGIATATGAGAGAFNGAEMPITVVAAVSGLSTGTVFGFAATGSATPKLSLSVSGGTLSWTQASTAGTFTASVAISTGAHVVTATKANGSLTLRVDSAQVATTAVTAASETFNTFCVGALNSNGAVSSYLTGSLGTLAVYGAQGNTTGMADIFQVETYLLEQYGIIRSASSGINSGF